MSKRGKVCHGIKLLNNVHIIISFYKKEGFTLPRISNPVANSIWHSRFESDMFKRWPRFRKCLDNTHIKFEMQAQSIVLWLLGSIGTHTLDQSPFKQSEDFQISSNSEFVTLGTVASDGPCAAVTSDPELTPVVVIWPPTLIQQPVVSFNSSPSNSYSSASTGWEMVTTDP